MSKAVSQLLSLFFFVSGLFAQTESLQDVKYPKAFRFKEGIYITHQQLLQNKPIPKSSIISKHNKNSFDFFERLIDEGELKFFNEYGLLTKVNVSDIWGFCRKGSVFINWGNDFSRITIVGNISHFVASITYNNNFFYGSPFQDTYYNTPESTNHSELQQFLMDFNSGKIYAYTINNVLTLLKPDTELYNAYENLRKRKKKAMKFIFIRKFNEKHPLNIAIN